MAVQPEAAPDMQKLFAAGVSLEDAIAQCEAWQKAHPPEPEPQAEPPPVIKEHMVEEPVTLNLAMYMPPVPAPEPAKRVEELVTDTERFLCLSVLHTLSEQISGIARPDPTPLVWQGFSSSTARELVDFIRRGNS
jgi:hypothetical protein